MFFRKKDRKLLDAVDGRTMAMAVSDIERWHKLEKRLEVIEESQGKLLAAIHAVAETKGWLAEAKKQGRKRRGKKTR